MPINYIFCNVCQTEFKVTSSDGYVSCPDCGQEFKLSENVEVEFDSLKGDLKESELDYDPPDT